jgi:hypothetical protein
MSGRTQRGLANDAKVGSERKVRINGRKMEESFEKDGNSRKIMDLYE